MKTKLLTLLLFVNFAIYAQYTSIPDNNFENKLIALGLDSGTPDNQVLTSNIDKLTSIDISNSSIVDLTGIQGFASLTNLNCYGNQLITLDVSKNIALQKLTCSSNPLTSLNISTNIALENLECSSTQLISLDVSANTALKYLSCSHTQLTALDLSKNTALEGLISVLSQLTSLNVSKNILLESLDCSSNSITVLDVSNNIALKYLACGGNLLTTLDVSKNTLLENLSCGNNQLTALNVSKNTSLQYLNCYSNLLTALDLSTNIALKELYCLNNRLTSLNLKNGNNSSLIFMDCKVNSNLNCIQVDDTTYSNANWSTYKDAAATYNLTCPTLGLSEAGFEKIAVYPNPVKGELHIDNSPLEKATVYDAFGKLITTTKFTKNNTNNNINLAGLQNGIYYIYLENEGATIVKKILVQ